MTKKRKKKKIQDKWSNQKEFQVNISKLMTLNSNFQHLEQKQCIIKSKN
jgi:hypothetical protein